MTLCELKNAWLSPEGEWHPVEMWGHCEYARLTFDCEPEQLLRHGWIKLSESDWFSWKGEPHRVTQTQFDQVAEWYLNQHSPVQPDEWDIK